MNETKKPLRHLYTQPLARANEDNIVSGQGYRFTLLSPKMIRMEYHPNNRFEDNKSQVVMNRYTPKVDHQVASKDGWLMIKTESLSLAYKIGYPFSRESLEVKMETRSILGTGLWRYGMKEHGNFMGTARTLDNENGSTELEEGLLSDEGYHVIDDSNSYLFNEDGWLQSRDGLGFDLYFLGYEKDYKGCLRDYYELTGRPPLLPRYLLGNWWSKFYRYKDSELLEHMDNFENHGIPLSVCVLDMDWHTTKVTDSIGTGWTGYTWNEELFRDPRDFLEELKKRHLRSSLNLHPAHGIRKHEFCYEKMSKRLGREDLAFDPTDVEYLNAYFEEAHHPHEDIGVDFWWLDWQQGRESALEGLDPLWILNHFHFLDSGRDSSKRPFVFSRWSGLGGHRYPIGFSGDTVVSWDSLAFQPYFTTTAANVGYGWWSHDIGGHFMGTEDSELYTRWVQFGAFSPIMRLHSSSNFYHKREPWRHVGPYKEAAISFMRLRHELLPYLYSINYQHAGGDLPLVTPVYFHWPHRGEAYAYRGSYYFGSQLLVAPFVEPMDPDIKVSQVEAWLPDGLWFDYLNGSHYEGGKVIKFYGGIDKYPVFAKAGAIIPKQNLDMISHLNRTDNPKDLIIEIFPGASNSFEIYEDDGITSSFNEGLRHITRIKISYEKGMSIKVEGEGERTVIPDDRQIILKFKNFKTLVASDSGHILDRIGDDQLMTLTNENHQIQLQLTGQEQNAEEIGDLAYQYVDTRDTYIEEIMELLEHASIKSSYKQQIGYVNGNNRDGILGMKTSKLDKVRRIAQLNIPCNLKEAIMSILLRGAM